MDTRQTSGKASAALPEVALDADYFTVLGLPRRFDLQEGDIDAAYRSVARRVHPDRFSSASPETVDRATKLSAAVNEAYRTLNDPVTRAGYLLSLAGGPGPDEVRDVPGNLLAEVMMLREQVETEKAAGEREALNRHRRELERRRAETLERIAAAAQHIAEADDDRKKSLRIELNAIKYYDNLLQELAQDPLASRHE